MLEKELKDLTAEVKALRELLNTIAKDVAFYRPEADMHTPADDVIPGFEKPKEDPKSEPEKAVKREDVQSKCMEIVRADRSKKDSVAEIIASFGGAKTLKEVKDDDLAALMTKLEAL
jgi:hypothetical protein